MRDYWERKQILKQLGPIYIGSDGVGRNGTAWIGAFSEYRRMLLKI